MLVLIHSSKAMRGSSKIKPASVPEFIKEANQLSDWLATLCEKEVGEVMELNSEKKILEVYNLLQGFSVESGSKQILKQVQDDVRNVAAIEGFIGDIYSGLQLPEWNEEDLEYAQQHLRILSGLYGILKPLDKIRPYRLEMGYKFRGRELLDKFKNMYQFWGDKLVAALPDDDLIIDLTAKEYSKTIKKALKERRVIAPKFLTVNTKSGEPKQVIVHTKVARGAFARWIIQNKISEAGRLKEFAEIGYKFAPELSTELEPVFVAEEFKGTGLSIRLLK